MSGQGHEDLAARSTYPPFASLRAFEAVFRYGGIRKAAIRIGINHAAVGRHLRLLEDWLGAPLIERTGNRLSLTQGGVEFHARISAALGDITRAADEFMGKQKAGHVRISCVSGLAIEWLAAQLAEFERLNPDFHVQMKPCDDPPDVLAHESDADIRFVRDGAADIARGMKSFEIARPDVMAVASPALAERLNALPSAAALVDEQLLHEEHQEHQGEWHSWLGQNGVAIEGEMKGPLCWHTHLALTAARLGRGIALANLLLVRSDIERGVLVEINVPGTRRVPLGSYQFFAREDRWSTPVLQALRRFLYEQANHLLRN